MKEFSQAPTEPGFVQNPYPAYAAARATGPVLYWPAYDMAAVFSHAEVDRLLRHKDLGREIPADLRTPAPGHLKGFYKVEDNSILELEGARHARLRRLVLGAFTSARIKALEPPIRALCHDLCDAIEDAQTVDLLDSYCRPLPVTVIARLLGVPETDGDQLLAWSNAMVGMYQAGRTRTMEDAADAAARAFSDYLAGHINARRAVPDDGLLSGLIAARDSDASLSAEELVATAILLLNAGHEATVHSLGNTIKLLLETGHRGDWAACVEEGLRMDPPLHLFTRWVYKPVEVAGRVLQPGTQIALMLGAAARDPAAWPDPDRFDPARFAARTASQTAFGAGRHFCLGAPLARLEMEIALEVLFARFPEIALAEEPRYADIYHFHGLERLRVTL